MEQIRTLRVLGAVAALIALVLTITGGASWLTLVIWVAAAALFITAIVRHTRHARA